MFQNSINKVKVGIFFVAFFVCVFLLYVSYQLFVPLPTFPIGEDFMIQNGQTGVEIFSNLEKIHAVRSVFWAKVAAKILNTQKFYRGEYLFDKPLSTFEVVREITSRPVSLAVLIPEGFTKKQIAERLAKYIVHFNKSDFLKNAQEGYLFPETYYFFKFSTNEEILKEFSNKYNQEMLKNFGRLPTKSEVIIASMIEREAKDSQDMKIISGIIQNRLKVGMPLQIDATVLYGQGIWQERVYYSNLKHKSDYNTYQNTGLPPGPISNPGLNALRAAMYPSKTKYFYYLTGKDGKMYYAVSNDEHIDNKIKYLR